MNMENPSKSMTTEKDIEEVNKGQNKGSCNHISPFISSIYEPGLLTDSLTKNKLIEGSVIKGREYEGNVLIRSIIPNYLRLIKEIGRGNYGIVYKTVNIATRDTICLKVCYDSKDRFSGCEEVYSKLKGKFHPNLIDIHKATFAKNRIAVQMEYINCVTLLDLCKSMCDKKQLIPLGVSAYIMKSILTAVTYLNVELNVIHRDIKLDNVLISDRGEVKLCDFGLSLIKGMRPKEEKMRAGTPMYMPPEAFGVFSHARDLDLSESYQVGYIWYMLLNLRDPFKKTSLRTIDDLVSQMKLPYREHKKRVAKGDEETIMQVSVVLCDRLLRAKMSERMYIRDANSYFISHLKDIDIEQYKEEMINMAFS